MVDRIYAFEMLVESALLRVEIEVARDWLDPAEVGAIEAGAAEAARTGARVVRDWAVRELALRGRRLCNVPGQGWESLGSTAAGGLASDLLARLRVQSRSGIAASVRRG